jgi:quercetin dioxygenase-like cupin family protein
VLTLVANALSVRLEELLGPPKASARLVRAAELPTRQRGQVSVRRLLPESMPGLDLERMELAAGARMTGVPHTPGTREYLTCERGEVVLSAAGQQWSLQPGDVVVFRGDQKHGYHNPGRNIAVAYSVIAFAPVGASQ